MQTSYPKPIDVKIMSNIIKDLMEVKGVAKNTTNVYFETQFN